MKPKDIVFIVGAGISKGYPSNIPLGKELTEYILQKSCGKSESDCIFNLWGDFSKEISKYDENLNFSIPRLETILGCIQEIDQLTHRRSILYGLKSFGKIPFNENHRILADFLSQGSNIVTTNFDLGIENAYEMNYKKLEYITHDSYSEFSNKDTGSIYHIHGSSRDSIDKLGATVKKVKEGLNQKTKERLDHIIKKCKAVVFLGYSVSDSFDITPYFEDIKFKINKVVFVQHSISNTIKTHPSNLPRLVKNANYFELLFIDTTNYLDNLSREMLLEIDSLKNTESQNQVYDWKAEFAKCWNYSYTKDEMLLNLLGIRFQIGFNTKIIQKIRPDIINEINKLADNNNYNNHILDRYLSEAVRSFDILNEESINKPTDIVTDKVDYIDRQYLLKLNSECKYYYLKYKDTFKEVEKEDLIRIDELITILELYSHYSFKQVQYISYIITSLKYLALFKSRFKKEYTPDICKTELLLSLDISYIEGSIAALTHYSEHCIYLRELSGDSKYDYEINKALSTAYELSKISGYNYHCRIIENLIYNYDFVNLI